MRAIIVRHYKTLLNASGQILGWGDAPRAADWRGDLAFVEDALRERRISPDVIYASALERARQTAIHYAQRSGMDSVHTSPALNEVNYGLLFGKSKKWVTRTIPQHKTDPDFVYPEGESFRQMQRRSVRFLVSLTRLHPGQTVLIVVHAGVIRGLVSHFLGLDYGSQLRQKISHRFIGDFRFVGERCAIYDELGQASGFVRSGMVTVPLHLPPATAPSSATGDAPRVAAVPMSTCVEVPAHPGPEHP